MIKKHLKVNPESAILQCLNSFEKFLQIFQGIVQIFPPSKKRIIHYNKKCLTKGLRKAIMTRSKLINKYNKNRTQNWTRFKKQRNKCVKI